VYALSRLSVKASIAKGYRSVLGLSETLSAKRQKRVDLALSVCFRGLKRGKAEEKAELEHAWSPAGIWKIWG
jgi:hypothetical protein